MGLSRSGASRGPDGPLTDDEITELAGRAKWAGLLADVEPLTETERERLHRALADRRTPMRPLFDLPAAASAEFLGHR